MTIQQIMLLYSYIILIKIPKIEKESNDRFSEQ